MAGLRQQQHGRVRTGQQRPSTTNQGGANGRPQLSHNGARPTSPGGTNAQGTGASRPAATRPNSFPAGRPSTPARPGRPKPVDPRPDYWHAPPGFFQYGHNQWGHINDRGMINWNAKQPTEKDAQIYGWNQITPNLKKRGLMGKIPQQQGMPNPFVDDLYARNMAEHELDTNTSLQGSEHAIGMLDFELGKEKENTSRKFKVDREQLSSQLGAAGLDESGIAAGTMGIAAQDFSTFIDDLVEEHAAKVSNERVGQQRTRNAFDLTKAAEVGLAKDRWLLEHPGATLPDVKTGLFQQDGQWYHMNPDTGITTTFKPSEAVVGKPEPVAKPVNPKPAKPARPKPVKPKHPNAKTYTVNGQVRQIRR